MTTTVLAATLEQTFFSCLSAFPVMIAYQPRNLFFQADTSAVAESELCFCHSLLQKLPSNPVLRSHVCLFSSKFCDALLFFFKL